MKVCFHVYVTGKVQGVWFRASTKKEAERLGVQGYARNLPDGRVEVMACGERELVEALFAWLQVGPELADVTDVSCEEIAWREFDGFRVV